MIYLNCPFNEKDQAKALGARWDKDARQWYINEGTSLEPFQKWLPSNVAISKIELVSPDTSPQYTVRQFIFGLKAVFHEIYATEIWLIGQITKLKLRGESIEIQLMDCENNLDLKNACTMTVMVWNDQSRFIFAKMEKSGLKLEEGLLINVKIRPKFHQRYHIGGDVLDIDPTATLGEFALLQRQLREKLKKEGLYEKNKLLPQPFDYCRVAVIHPPNASGYHDFKKDADVLQKLNLCQFTYFSSSFEGVKTEEEFLLALDLAFKQHQKSALDAVIIIRGGGARQGLLNLVKESILRKICLAPVPIMVGLGHADDKLLLDEVANISLDTPSKTIAYIKNTIQKNAHGAISAFHDIGKSGSYRLRLAETQVHNKFAVIVQQSQTAINKQDKKIDVTKQQILNESKLILNKRQNQLLLLQQQLLNAQNLIIGLEHKIVAYMQQIFGSSKNILLNVQSKLAITYNDIQTLTTKASNHYIITLNHLRELVTSFNPDAVLKRGYTLPLNNQQQVIRSVKQAKIDQSFFLKFHDGQCSVKIDNLEDQ